MINQSNLFYKDICFNALKDIVLKKTGICLSKHNLPFVCSRIQKRLNRIGVNSFCEYMQLLSFSEEEEKFINLITNSSTEFFREIAHFQYLKENYFPYIFYNKKRIRIWSASCATGEEAYSLAITVNEVLPRDEDYDIKILATDINTENLSIAKLGIYPKQRISNLSMDRQKDNFCKYESEDFDLVRVKDHLRQMISFRQLNLIHEWPMHGPFELILIRNTIMYFDKEVIRNVLRKIDQLLELNGVLILGHTETIRNYLNNYELIGHSIYRKVSEV